MRKMWLYLFVSFEKTPMSLLFSYCKPVKAWFVYRRSALLVTYGQP